MSPELREGGAGGTGPPAQTLTLRIPALGPQRFTRGHSDPANGNLSR